MAISKKAERELMIEALRKRNAELEGALRLLMRNVETAAAEMPNNITDKATRILKCAPRVWPGMNAGRRALSDPTAKS